MIILNEKEFAENCLQQGLGDSNPNLVIFILAKYYYHCCGFRKKKITKLLIDFLSKYYPRYEFDELSWKDTIKKISTNVKKYPLHQISGIIITKSEIETIQNIKNKVLERLMFTMLCLAKLSNSKNPNNNGWVNADSREIYKYARIQCNIYEREIKIGQLGQKGLLEFPKRIDNLNCRVTFINDDSEEKLFISDFRELGYEYRKYKGENYIRCQKCGILTRGNKNGTKKYCKKCAGGIPQEKKNVICIDCGKMIEIKSKDNQTCRCSNCYEIYRKKRKLETQRIRRKRNNEVSTKMR